MGSHKKKEGVVGEPWVPIKKRRGHRGTMGSHKNIYSKKKIEIKK
jgi:hypothetical protein